VVARAARWYLTTWRTCSVRILAVRDDQRWKQCDSEGNFKSVFFDCKITQGYGDILGVSLNCVANVPEARVHHELYQPFVTIDHPPCIQSFMDVGKRNLQLRKKPARVNPKARHGGE
jgi:hypothetical protein